MSLAIEIVTAFSDEVEKIANSAVKLSPSMTESQFDSGYWYDRDLKALAAKIGVPGATKLRKDELEKSIKHYFRTKTVISPTERSLTRTGKADTSKGLSIDLPITNYTSNKETKTFLMNEAKKIDPTFKDRSGTKYLLNRWREQQVTDGKKVTYGDLVKHLITLNKTKTGPLRVEHGRYMNFISDFMANHENATQEKAVQAWHEVKKMDVPKTYKSWAGNTK